MQNYPNIIFLRYFYSAAKHGSISKSALENFVTQSAVSQGIKKLEIELGKQLISTSKNRLELTQDGIILLENCDEIFSAFSKIKDLFNETEGVYKGRLSFAVNHSFAISFLPIHFKHLFTLHPEIKPVLRVGHSGIIREWVLNNEVEFGLILAREKDYHMYETVQVFQGNYGIYRTDSNDQPVSNRLIISQDSNEDREIINHLRGKAYEMPPIVEVLSWEAIAAMIKENIGVGVLPDYVAKRYNLTLAEIDVPLLPYSIIGISSKKKGLSRNANMFLELMKGQYEQPPLS